MSARSVAEHALTVYYEDSKDPAGMARKVLDACAHELAEKIRASCSLRERDSVSVCPTCKRDADLIDPEVSNNGV